MISDWATDLIQQVAIETAIQENEMDDSYILASCSCCGISTKVETIEGDKYDYFVCTVCGHSWRIESSDWGNSNRIIASDN